MDTCVSFVCKRFLMCDGSILMDVNHHIEDSFWQDFLFLKDDILTCWFSWRTDLFGTFSLIFPFSSFYYRLIGSRTRSSSFSFTFVCQNRAWSYTNLLADIDLPNCCHEEKYFVSFEVDNWHIDNLQLDPQYEVEVKKSFVCSEDHEIIIDHVIDLSFFQESIVQLRLWPFS